MSGSSENKVSDHYVMLLTGANRGLGLEFVRQMLTDDHPAVESIPKGFIVVATVRDPSNCPELKKLQEQYPGRVDIVKLEVTSADDIKVCLGDECLRMCH